MNGQGITLYGDTSSSDTAGGNDGLSIAGFVSSTVYGAAGGDTLILEGGSESYFDLGAGTNFATGGSSYQSSTLLGGSGADVFYLNGITSGYVDAGAGADSVVFNNVVKGASATSRTTILGGTGTDTLYFAASVQHSTIMVDLQMQRVRIRFYPERHIAPGWLR